jgi:hypothetical protein
MHEAINKRVRDMLNIFLTNVDHLEAISNLFYTLSEEIKKIIVSAMSPSKITTKRKHSFLAHKVKRYKHNFLSPRSKKIQTQFFEPTK